MAVVGHLTEFPLPEVFTLIGKRTGRMRLLDIPAANAMTIDIMEGSITFLSADEQPVTAPERILEILSHVIQGNSGMFDFQVMEAQLLGNGLDLPIDRLAMNLCCAVDEQASDTQRLLDNNQRFRLIAEVNSWIDPDLDDFLSQIHDPLTRGVNVEEAGKITGRLPETALDCLVKLRDLGVVDIISSPGNDEHLKSPTSVPSPETWKKITQSLAGRGLSRNVLPR